MVISPLI
jgi:hypothetical protein